MPLKIIDVSVLIKRFQHVSVCPMMPTGLQNSVCKALTYFSIDDEAAFVQFQRQTFKVFVEV